MFPPPYFLLYALCGYSRHVAAAFHLALVRERNTDSEYSDRFNEAKSEALSSLMRKSWTSGQFWFNECLRAYNFDLIYWLRLHDLHYGGDKSVECCVNDWAAIKLNGHIDGFIVEKLRDCKAYWKELDALHKAPGVKSEDETNGRAEHNDGKENERPQVVIHEEPEEQEQEVITAAVEMGKVTLSGR